MKARTVRACLPSVTVGFGVLAVFSLILLMMKRNPVAALCVIIEGGFGSALGFKETLARTIPLLFCGLATALPAKVGLLNIGGEGQLHLGAIGATAVVLLLPGAPTPVLLTCMAVGAMLGGATCALLPALLRGWLNVSEVLVALMLNYVGILLMQHLLHGVWKDPSALGWPYSKEFPSSAMIPSLSGSKVHLGLAVALLIAVVAHFALQRTTFGFSTRYIRVHEPMARYLKLNVPAFFCAAMVLGGACAALAGMGEVSVVQHRLRPSISANYGYIGFMLAWLAGNHLLVLIPMTILVAGLYAGADLVQLDLGLPAAAAETFIALIFLGVIVARTTKISAQRRATG